MLMSMMSMPVCAQKIGLLMDSYGSDHWYLDQKLFTEKVKQLGGTVQVEVAYSDTVEQVRLGKKLIADGVQVLVIIPVDGHKAAEIVTLAKQAKIPVIAYDRLINSKDLDLYLSYNNEKIGELQAQYALDRVPQGKFLLLNGPVRDLNAILFRKGQHKVLKQSIAEGKVKLVADIVMEDWGEIGALMKMDDFYSSASEKPDVIIAANDALASGAIFALPEELKGKVVITGQDADLSSLQFIVSGTQSMTIYKPIKPMAHLAAEVAIKLAKGLSIEGTKKFKNEHIEVNSILLDPVVVDKNNFKETVVKDGHVTLTEMFKK